MNITLILSLFFALIILCACKYGHYNSEREKKWFVFIVEMAFAIACLFVVVYLIAKL